MRLSTKNSQSLLGLLGVGWRPFFASGAARYPCGRRGSDKNSTMIIEKPLSVSCSAVSNDRERKMVPITSEK